MSKTLRSEIDGLILLERRIANSVDDMSAVVARQAMIRNEGFEGEDRISDSRRGIRGCISCRLNLPSS